MSEEPNIQGTINELKKSNIIYVEREKHNIDILITGDDSALIIENKIYAEDQPEQLRRYYEIIKPNKKHIGIIYLTLDGHEPSESSVRDLDKDIITCISYTNEIKNWISESKQTSGINNNELRKEFEVIFEQYLRVIDYLIGKTLPEIYMKELVNLITENKNNFEIASHIYQSMDLAVNKIIADFWKTLKEEIINRNLTSEKLQEPKIEDTYQFIRWKLNENIYFQIEIYRRNKDFYFGFYTDEDSERSKKIEMIKEIDSNYKPENKWLGWRPFRYKGSVFSFTSDKLGVLLTKNEVSLNEKEDFYNALIA